MEQTRNLCPGLVRKELSKRRRNPTSLRRLTLRLLLPPWHLHLIRLCHPTSVKCRLNSLLPLHNNALLVTSPLWNAPARTLIPQLNNAQLNPTHIRHHRPIITILRHRISTRLLRTTTLLLQILTRLLRTIMPLLHNNTSRINLLARRIIMKSQIPIEPLKATSDTTSLLGPTYRSV